MKTVVPLAVLNAAKCIELYGQSAVMMVTAPDALCVYEVPAARVLAEWVMENCGSEEDVAATMAEPEAESQEDRVQWVEALKACQFEPGKRPDSWQLRDGMVTCTIQMKRPPEVGRFQCLFYIAWGFISPEELAQSAYGDSENLAFAALLNEKAGPSGITVADFIGVKNKGNE